MPFLTILQADGKIQVMSFVVWEWNEMEWAIFHVRLGLLPVCISIRTLSSIAVSVLLYVPKISLPKGKNGAPGDKPPMMWKNTSLNAVWFVWKKKDSTRILNECWYWNLLQRVAAQPHHLHFTRTTVMLTFSNQAEIWCEASYDQNLIPNEISAHIWLFFIEIWPHKHFSSGRE